jgi:hypothetical protein
MARRNPHLETMIERVSNDALPQEAGAAEDCYLPDLAHDRAPQWSVRRLSALPIITSVSAAICPSARRCPSVRALLFLSSRVALVKRVIS